MAFRVGVATVATVCVAVALAGCSSTAQVKERTNLRLAEADAPPADFTVAFTVLAPASSDGNPRVPRGKRPARYVMEADGVLRSAVGMACSEETFPPRTRQLTKEQVKALWDEMRRGGLLDADHPDMIGPAPSAEALGTRTTFVVSYAALGRHRRLAVPDSGSVSSEAAAGLADRLAALSWINR